MNGRWICKLTNGGAVERLGFCELGRRKGETMIGAKASFFDGRSNGRCLGLAACVLSVRSKVYAGKDLVMLGKAMLYTHCMVS